MTCEVLLFGPYADAAERSSVTVHVDEATRPTAGAVLQQLGEQYPNLRPMLSAALLAVNRRTVLADQPVDAADELAVIGLVSGG